jgi:penicillin amidase
MEATRRVFSGTASELFGDKALAIDKFSRSIGYVRLAEETLKELAKEERDILDAYADGVNDFIESVKLTGENSSAKLLPPEFYIFGVTGDKLRKWSPVDTLALSRLVSLHLTWNFAQDFTREAVRQTHPDLAELFEEIIPFQTDYLHNLVTILDEADLKASN